MGIKSKIVFSVATMMLTLLSITAIHKTLLSEPSRYEGKIVRKIEFAGLKNYDEGDIVEVMVTVEGYPLKAAEVREDIKNIFALGYFDDVDVEIDNYSDGVKLRFTLKERPVIEKIEFKGNDKIIETDLIALLKIKEGDVFRKDLLEASIKNIREKYGKDGYNSSFVSYKLSDGKEKGQLKVDIIIDEGEEIKVKKFAILGAEKIYVKEIQDLIETKEDTIFNDGAFKKEVYEEDKRKIIGYYQEKGYLDAQFVEERVEYQWTDPEEPAGRSIYILLKLSEGEKYYFDGPYTIKIGDGKSEVLNEEEINKLKRSFLLQDNGEVFNNTKFMNDRQAISFLYASKGYIFARVIPNRTVTEKEVDVDGVKEKRKYVKIDYLISEGKKAYIEQVIIKGNKKTKDKVIRRELVFNEGEIFDADKMRISRENVFNLGYFKQVNFDVRPGTRDGYMNLVVDVEEQPSGTISMGGGYGSASGFSIFADITENNLFGNGQTVGLKFEYGPKKSSVTLSFKERWLFDYPVGFNSSIFYYLYEYSASSIFPESDKEAYYKKQGIGYSLGLSYRFWYHWVIGSTWVHTFKTYLDPSGDSSDEIFLTVARGQQEKRTVKFYLYYDSKDNYMNPTRGLRSGVAASFTGGALLRGDDHFIQYSPEFYAYYSPFHLPFLETHPTVLEFRLSGDFIMPPMGKNWTEKNKPYSENEWVESEDRLDIGGPETVRGWDYYDSEMPDSWRYVGLYHRILYGAEYRVPLHPQMLWLAFFFDAGALWSDKYWEKQLGDTNREYVNQDIESGRLRRIDQITDGDLLPYFIYSYGVGIKLQVPMMPLRFWFGRKMIYDDGFKTISGYKFQFSIGDMRF